MQLLWVRPNKRFIWNFLQAVNNVFKKFLLPAEIIHNHQNMFLHIAAQ